MIIKSEYIDPINQELPLQRKEKKRKCSTEEGASWKLEAHIVKGPIALQEKILKVPIFF